MHQADTLIAWLLLQEFHEGTEKWLMWLGSVVLLFPTYFTSMFISSIVMRLFDEVVMNSYKKALVLLFYPFFFQCWLRTNV